jgi:membrane protease YdiL (CAAX protease family)
MVTVLDARRENPRLAMTIVSPRPAQQSRREWVLRHPLSSYLLLAYVLSWSFWGIALIGGGMSLLVVGAFGPAVAAWLVTRWTGGSVREWLRPLLHWRVPLRFYAYALGLPAALFAAMNLILTLLGEPVEFSRLRDTLPTYLATFVFVALLGGGQEEPGWRGFALDRLQARHSPFVATLLLGLAWGFWHFPLYGLGFVGPLMFVFYYTWLYNRTGSLLLCVLLHGSFTPALDHLILVDDSPTVDAVILGTMLGGVLLLLALTRGRLGFDHRGWSAGSGCRTRKENGARDIVVGSHEQLGLNRELFIAQPTRDRARTTMMTIHVDGQAGVALSPVASLVTDVEPDK